MSAPNPFGFELENPFENPPQNHFDDEYMLESLNNYEWDIPEEVFEEKNLFAPAQDFPMFGFSNQQKESGVVSKPAECEQAVKINNPLGEQDKNSAESEPQEKIFDPKAPGVTNDDLNAQGLSSTDKSDNSSHRRMSTDNCDSLSDAKSKEDEETVIRITNVPDDMKEITPVCAPKAEAKLEPEMDVQIAPLKVDSKKEEDPDFCYKAPRKQKFEYNKRKDVILKTILRKCRRILQEDFNELTGYFSNRKMQGHQFLKDCIQKFHDSLADKPQSLDLLFYLGAMLYPQEMSRGVDCFFECDKKERVKQRKFYRAKIQKVHDVLYRYSHEKMDYFVNVPELSYLYSIFFKKASAHEDEDQYYMNGATEIFERCKETLDLSGISV